MEEYLTLFKQRLKIFHNAEDDLLLFYLEASKQDIFNKVGETDLSKNKSVLELIFDRARYSYNDSSEYFDDNFSTEIMNASIFNLEGETDGN